MKLEPVNKKQTSIYKPQVEVITISSPSMVAILEELKNKKFQDKHSLNVVYKYYKNLWEYIKKNNWISKEVILELEEETKKTEKFTIL